MKVRGITAFQERLREEEEKRDFESKNTNGAPECVIDAYAKDEPGPGNRVTTENTHNGGVKEFDVFHDCSEHVASLTDEDILVLYGYKKRKSYKTRC